MDWTQGHIINELRKAPRRNLKVVPNTEAFRAYFTEKIDHLVIQTRKIVAKGEEHVPTLFIFSNPKKFETGEQVAVVPVTQFNNSTHKDIVAGLQRWLASAPFVRSVVFLVETWTLGSGVKEMPTGSIANHPDRKDAVMFNMLYHDDNDNLQQRLRLYIREGTKLLDDGIMEIDTHAPEKGLMHGRFIHENDPQA